MIASFGHLFASPVGYAAGYYSYKWAEVLDADAFGRFKSEGMLNPTTARAWRAAVLSKGGGEDERAQVAHFLGREPNEQAYIAFLKGQD